MKLEIWMVRVVRNSIKNLDFLIKKVSFIYRAVHNVLQALPLWWGAKQQNGKTSAVRFLVLQLRLTSVRIWPVSLCSYFPTRPDAKTSLNVLVTVHVTFYCGCLTRQKLVFLYHMDIADRFSPKKGGIFDFRSENTTPRITKAHRTLDKQAKTNDGHSLAS